MKLNTKHLLFILIGLSLVIAFLELSLNLASVVSPRVNQILSPPGTSNIPYTMPDDRLGVRPNPNFPGHDRKGFRNPSVPNRAEIVVLGDSQTYGISVESQDTWPRQLESMTNSTVYSMACEAYGPVHYLILWDEAITLSPKIVVAAFYSGNDLFDSFDLVYNQNQFHELKNADPGVQISLASKENLESITERVSKLFRRSFEGNKRTLQQRNFLSKHSKLYGLLLSIRHELFSLIQSAESEYAWKSAKAFAETNSNYCQIFENGQFKTIFASEYRLSAIDLKDSRIAEGLRISLEAIKRMSDLAALNETQFLVVLIPTKELVFQNLIQNSSSSYRDLIQNEEQLWKTTKEFLKIRDIKFADALQALREQLSRGIQPYQISADGHPNKYGHQAIARLVYTEIQRKQSPAK